MAEQETKPAGGVAEQETKPAADAPTQAGTPSSEESSDAAPEPNQADQPSPTDAKGTTPSASESAAPSETPAPAAEQPEEAPEPEAAPTESAPPNFNEMTSQQQYDYLKDVVITQAGGDESAWKTGEDEVNLVGIRSWQDGQAGTTEGNTYNDTVYAVRMHDGQPEVVPFRATVDAGIDPGGTGFGYFGPEGHGFSHVADGYYPDGSFTEMNGGNWGVGTVLGQTGNLRINVDLDNNAVIGDGEYLDKTVDPSWGIFFHPGGQGENVGSWSAGCQSIRPEQYDGFQRILLEDPNDTHGYTLIDSRNLPLVQAP